MGIRERIFVNGLPAVFRNHKRQCFLLIGIGILVYYFCYITLKRKTIVLGSYNLEKHKCRSQNQLDVDAEFSDYNETALPWYFKNGTLRPVPGQPGLKLWPDEQVCSDRITDQLMFVPENYSNESPIKKILLWRGLFKHSWFLNPKTGAETFVKSNCPVDRCYITTDREEAQTVDAILFYAKFDLPEHKKPPNQVWIMFLLEAPYLGGNVEYDNVINWTATYRRDSDLTVPYGKWVYYNESVQQQPLTRNYAENKTKNVVWFVSNCYANNDRVKYGYKLKEYVSVDIYGKCGTLSCEDNECKKMISNYKFYLAFENANCFSYITEKLFENSFWHDTIPIVMGPTREEYEMVAPYHSFIHVDDFSSPEYLAAYLKMLDVNDDLYNEYFQWKGTGEFIDSFVFCRICAFLHSTYEPKVYSDWKQWWSEDTCARYETYNGFNGFFKSKYGD